MPSHVWLFYRRLRLGCATLYHRRMGGHGLLRLMGMVLLGHVTITWVQFSSTIYPYTISQPSSFSHIVYPKDPRHKLDYFSPALGSATTDVNIIAIPGDSLPDSRNYLRDQGGFHVRSDGWVTVESRRRRITEADFQ